MLSTVATLALSFGLAQGAAVSLFPKAEVTASAYANSTSTSTCPTDYATVTKTATESGSGTITKWVTSTVPAATHVVTLNDYVTTISSSAGPLTTDTEYSYTSTTTNTYYDYVTVGSCTSTATVTAESTSTVYTGSFTPTALTTYCVTNTAYETTFLDGAATVTSTQYIQDSRVTSTSYEAATYTDYYYDTTTTVTTPALSYTYTDAVSTETYGTDCKSTSYTATASTTATQAAKCAPTNMISGLNSIGNAGGIEVESFWRTDNPANRDASSCCQACVDDEECVAMDYLEGEGYGCELWRNADDKCEGALLVEYGIGNFVAQAGCGDVLLNPAYW